MKITYFHHSGFAVETQTKVLVFDYYTQGARFDFFDPKAYGDKEFVFFVSHAHDDHFDRRIFQWMGQAVYVLSSDARGKDGAEILYVEPHESYDFHDMTIETLRSNDEGVAFLVQVDGRTIYHAGDLNWWHWNGEGDSFNEEIAASYTGEIARLKGKEIDVAFVPSDLRLEDKYFWAVDYFMKEIGAKALFPTHFWGRFDVCQMLKEQPYGDKIMEISEENQSFSL